MSGSGYEGVSQNCQIISKLTPTEDYNYDISDLSLPCDTQGQNYLIFLTVWITNTSFIWKSTVVCMLFLKKFICLFKSAFKNVRKIVNLRIRKPYFHRKAPSLFSFCLIQRLKVLIPFRFQVLFSLIPFWLSICIFSHQISVISISFSKPPCLCGFTFY